MLNKKFDGITEFIAHKTGCQNKATMLIYSKKLSVTPITTHIPVKKISSTLEHELQVAILKKAAIFEKEYRRKTKKN